MTIQALLIYWITTAVPFPPKKLLIPPKKVDLAAVSGVALAAFLGELNPPFT